MNTVKIQHRQKILNWLQKKNKWELKNILTIKNKQSQSTLDKIFNLTQSKGQIILMGLSLVAADYNNLYTKKTHKYPKQSRQIKSVAAAKLQNSITINRNDKLVSVKMGILSQLPQIMDTLSDQGVFAHIMQKRGSLWFDKGSIHSFAQWMVHFLQTQILDAYENQKTISEALPLKVWANLYLSQKQKAQEIIFQQLYSHCRQNVGDQKGKQAEQNAKAEAKYFYSQFTQKIEQKDSLKQPYQQYIQYVWISTNEKQLYHKIMQKVYSHVDDMIKDQIFNLQVQQIDKFNQTDKKKKKRRGKKNTIQQETLQKIQSNQQTKQEQKQIKSTISHSSTVPQEKKQQIFFQNNQKPQSSKKFYNRTQEIDCSDLSKNIKKQLQNEIYRQQNKIQSLCKQQNIIKEQNFQVQVQIKKNFDIQKTKDFKLQNQNQKTNQQKSIVQLIKSKNQIFVTTEDQKKSRQIKTRISEYFNNYVSKLKQNSNKVELHRKAAIALIQHAIKDMKLKFNWQLKRFGSCQADFELQQSDIDLVLCVTEEGLSLQNLLLVLKVQKWILNCQLIPASIPILTFDLDLKLYEAQILKQRQMKKCPTFRIDLSISKIYENHTGLQNTKYLKQLLMNFPVLKETSYILKQLLRLKNLNKPYMGGISSFVLVSMIFGILIMRNKLQNSCIFQQLQTVVSFMTNQFIPKKTIIYISKQSQQKNQLKADSTIHLNIENPISKGMLKTSAFKIDQIINQLRILNKMLYYLYKQVNSFALEQKKRVKKAVFQAIQQFFIENEVENEEFINLQK